MLTEKPSKKVLNVFGTRPEVIKFAPILRYLAEGNREIQSVNISSGQHTNLLYPLIRLFKLRIDYDLLAMTEDQSPFDVCQRVLHLLLPILDCEQPDLILVQGDTATALAGALAGRNRRVPVAHVEAGLRSGDLTSPFPEEANRQAITQLATYHFAPTVLNREALLREGVRLDKIFLTGNPGIDSLVRVLATTAPSEALRRLLESTRDQKRLVLTTHRRENFGTPIRKYLTAVRQFAERNPDIAVIFPVHPNPAVVEAAHILRCHPRIHVLEPLDYPDFIHLMDKSSLMVSDSGGIQEEATALGRPLLILRSNTERPEAICCGTARLVGPEPQSVIAALEETIKGEPVCSGGARCNPFGNGDSGRIIYDVIRSVLGISHS